MYVWMRQEEFTFNVSSKNCRVIFLFEGSGILFPKFRDTLKLAGLFVLVQRETRQKRVTSFRLFLTFCIVSQIA